VTRSGALRPALVLENAIEAEREGDAAMHPLADDEVLHVRNMMEALNRLFTWSAS
jgi:hypothetical protein